MPRGVGCLCATRLRWHSTRKLDNDGISICYLLLKLLHFFLEFADASRLYILLIFCCYLLFSATKIGVLLLFLHQAFMLLCEVVENGFYLVDVVAHDVCVCDWPFAALDPDYVFVVPAFVTLLTVHFLWLDLGCLWACLRRRFHLLLTELILMNR